MQTGTAVDDCWIPHPFLPGGQTRKVLNVEINQPGSNCQISGFEPRVLFIHCYGHALNLSVSDTVK